MFELTGRHDLFFLPPDVHETVKAPISPDKQLYIGHVLTDVELAGFAELTIDSLPEEDRNGFRISGSFQDEAVPLQLSNGGYLEPEHDGHVGFREPVTGLDIVVGPDERWLADLPPDMVTCAPTVEKFLSLVSLGVRQKIAKRNPITD